MLKKKLNWASGATSLLLGARVLILETSTHLFYCCYFLPMQRGLRASQVWCKYLNDTISG